MCEISVIIPAYNAEKYINKIISDLSNQSFKNFEIIMIDDASHDKTVEVAKKCFLKTSMNYQIISSTKNNGVSKSRNIGIDKSNGKYIYFIDSDDRIEFDCLYELYKTIEKNNSDMAICNYNLVNENFEVVKNSYSLGLGVDLEFKSNEFIKKVIDGYYTIYLGCVLYKKKIINDNKLKFIEGSKFGEDREFLIKAIFYSKNISLSMKVLFYYVQNHLSVTHKKTNLSIFHNIGTFYRLAIYLKKHNASDDILNYIYKVRIPENIVDTLIKLIISGYPKGKLNAILKNKKIKEAIGRYKISLRSKKDLKRSIKILLFKLWPRSFYLINKLRKTQ